MLNTDQHKTSGDHEMTDMNLRNLSGLQEKRVALVKLRAALAGLRGVNPEMQAFMLELVDGFIDSIKELKDRALNARTQAEKDSLIADVNYFREAYRAVWTKITDSLQVAIDRRSTVH
jgi:hypothetical protein